MEQSERDRRWAIVYLWVQAALVLAWWIFIVVTPGLRQRFAVRGAPSGTLFAFAPADLALLVITSVAAAYGLQTRKVWAWGALCTHCGAALYAALYSLLLPAFGDVTAQYLGGYMMLPYLLVPPYFVSRLRPR